MIRELPVAVPGHRYSVWVGEGLLERAHELIPPAGAEKIAMFLDDAVAPAAARLERGIGALGLPIASRSLSGEERKAVNSADDAWRWLADNGYHRNDLVLAFGGGVVGDLSGFVAATYHRGMPWVVVPTTLLAMVDSSIGGKTGVNLPEGKNLVGAFHQPLAVIADTTMLATLPDREFATGLAEVVKHALISSSGLASWLHEHRAALRARDGALLPELVAAAATVKIDIVSQDEKESGARAFLNYGHTLGHALEALGGYTRWSHGEAVSIGLMFSANLAVHLGYPDRVSEHREALGAFGLPTTGADEDFEAVRAMWERDKKYRHGVRFVVLEDLGRPVLTGEVPEAALRKAFEAVR